MINENKPVWGKKKEKEELRSEKWPHWMYNITGWKGTPQSTQVWKIQDTVGPTIF